MHDPDTIELALEMGVDPDDFSTGTSDLYADDSGVAFHQQNQYPPQYVDFQDDIENSSPSPPERRVAPRMSQPFMQQPSYQETDYIEEYEDDAPYQRATGHQKQYQNVDMSRYQNQQTFERSTPNNYTDSRILQPVPFGRTQNNRFGSHLQPQNVSANYQIQPIPNRSSDQNYHQYNAPQSTARNPRSEPQFSQSQPDYRRGENPRNSHGTRLRPVSELPDIYRSLFKFGVFNAVQSMCFDIVLHSDENLVISAPTGSGKTVLFEISIIRMLNEAARTGQAMKCVYMAPTKALCSERYRDWTAKFDALGIKCCELTGDTIQFGKGTWGDAKTASIIITTGEKWDSLTRNWGDHGHILCQIQLFLVDEVHILNESRGSTLEVVVSRMKARGSNVRFLLVSATVPNIDDVASWIGDSNNGLAKIFEFGEEYRPCKLTRFVYPISKHKGCNDWVFASILDQKLFPILQQHSVNKPILIFCPTRKGCVQTAQLLAREYDKAVKLRGSLPWSQPKRIDHQFHDKVLADLALAGVGVHHAGLSFDDRRGTEDLYLNKILRVIVSTSTLAVGVNLPAHTVVIKGVKVFQNNATKEYSDLDVMQMMGRAGRPQFDKEGIAIILCESELEQKYKALANGTTKLESSLHLHLDEHLNSEIGLGTITNVGSAKEWLRNSFLWRRLQKNPKHYAIGKGDNETWQSKIDELVMQSVKKLKETELVEYESEGDGELCSTEYGDIMSKFYIRQSTMSLILKLQKLATFREIMETVCASEELADLKIRAGEKAVYDKLRQHDNIRFEIKKIQKTSDKIFLLVQAVLGGISLNAPEYKKGDSQPQLEVFTIFRHITRVARALVEVAITKKLGAQIKHGLELVRCLTAKAWEDRPVVLRQLDQIGEKSLKVLAEHGINCLEVLLKQTPLRLETLLNRRSPFGFELLASAREFPEYSLSVTEVDVTSSPGGQKAVEVELSVDCSVVTNQSTAGASKAKKQQGRGSNMTTVLTLTSDLDFIDFRRIPTKALKDTKTFSVTAHLMKPSQSISVSITSESIAGISTTRTYKPKLNPNQFPTMDTRPRNSLEMDLMGLEDDPDFWDMGIDDEGEEIVPIKDLTKQPRDSDLNGKKTNTKKLTNNTVPTVLKVLDGKHVEPKKLANGNYQCNHPCKDKTKCRHFCCRDGLSEPPPAPKKRNTNSTAADNSKKPKPMISDESPSPDFSHAFQPSHTIQSKTNPKTAGRTDNMIQQLKNLHESAKDQKSLRIPEGQSLKLENPALSSTGQSRRRPKPPPPNFELTFADLDDGPSGNRYHIPDEDDEDLPDIYDLLNAPQPSDTKGQKNPSSTSDYSNSEIDALIRDIPMDEYEAELADDSHIHDDLDSGPPSYRPATPLPSRKRPREPQPPKHFDTRTDSASEGFMPSSPVFQPRKRNRSKAPLFLADFSDKDTNERNGNSKVPSFTDSNDKKTENRDGEECFTLDYSLFDIVPTPPHSSMDTTSLGSDSKPLTSDPFDPLIPDNSSPLKRYHTPHTLQDRQSSQQAFDQGFLRHSGSVSIFPVVTPSTTFPPNNSMLKVSNGSIMHQAESMNAQVDETGVPDNDLAELEAWLLSDAVIITD